MYASGACEALALSDSRRPNGVDEHSIYAAAAAAAAAAHTYNEHAAAHDSLALQYANNNNNNNNYHNHNHRTCAAAAAANNGLATNAATSGQALGNNIKAADNSNQLIELGARKAFASADELDAAAYACGGGVGASVGLGELTHQAAGGYSLAGEFAAAAHLSGGGGETISSATKANLKSAIQSALVDTGNARSAPFGELSGDAAGASVAAAGGAGQQPPPPPQQPTGAATDQSRILEMRKEKSRDAARSRRSKENHEFYELAKLLPLPAAITSQLDFLDKASIIRLTISFLKLRQFSVNGSPAWAPDFTTLGSVNPYTLGGHLNASAGSPVSASTCAEHQLDAASNSKSPPVQASCVPLVAGQSSKPASHLPQTCANDVLFAASSAPPPPPPPYAFHQSARDATQSIGGAYRPDECARVSSKTCPTSLFDVHQGTHILQSLDGFAFAIGRDGRFLYISETVSMYLGLSQVEMTGSSVFDYTHEHDHDELARQLGIKLTTTLESIERHNNTNSTKPSLELLEESRRATPTSQYSIASGDTLVDDYNYNNNSSGLCTPSATTSGGSARKRARGEHTSRGAYGAAGARAHHPKRAGAQTRQIVKVETTSDMAQVRCNTGSSNSNTNNNNTNSFGPHSASSRAAGAAPPADRLAADEHLVDAALVEPTGTEEDPLVRQFCIRMKSTLTKRGCQHFKSSGYRVVHVVAHLRSYQSNDNGHLMDPLDDPSTGPLAAAAAASTSSSSSAASTSSSSSSSSSASSSSSSSAAAATTTTTSTGAAPEPSESPPGEQSNAKHASPKKHKSKARPCGAVANADAADSKLPLAKVEADCGAGANAGERLAGDATPEQTANKRCAKPNKATVARNSSSSNNDHSKQTAAQKRTKIIGMVALAIALPPPSINELRLESDTFVLRLGLDLRVTHIEPKITELLQYPIELIAGRSLYALVHPADVHQVQRCHRDLLRKGQMMSGYYRLLARSGGYIWVQTCATLICNSNGGAGANAGSATAAAAAAAAALAASASASASSASVPPHSAGPMIGQMMGAHTIIDSPASSPALSHAPATNLCKSIDSRLASPSDYSNELSSTNYIPFKQPQTSLGIVPALESPSGLLQSQAHFDLSGAQSQDQCVIFVNYMVTNVIARDQVLDICQSAQYAPTLGLICGQQTNQISGANTNCNTSSSSSSSNNNNNNNDSSNNNNGNNNTSGSGSNNNSSNNNNNNNNGQTVYTSSGPMCASPYLSGNAQVSGKVNQRPALSSTPTMDAAANETSASSTPMQCNYHLTAINNVQSSSPLPVSGGASSEQQTHSGRRNHSHGHNHSKTSRSSRATAEPKSYAHKRQNGTPSKSKSSYQNEHHNGTEFDADGKDGRFEEQTDDTSGVSTNISSMLDAYAGAPAARGVDLVVSKVASDAGWLANYAHQPSSHQSAAAAAAEHQSSSLLSSTDLALQQQLYMNNNNNTSSSNSNNNNNTDSQHYAGLDRSTIYKAAAFGLDAASQAQQVHHQQQQQQQHYASAATTAAAAAAAAAVDADQLSQNASVAAMYSSTSAAAAAAAAVSANPAVYGAAAAAAASYPAQVNAWTAAGQTAVASHLSGQHQHPHPHHHAAHHYSSPYHSHPQSAAVAAAAAAAANLPYAHLHEAASVHQQHQHNHHQHNHHQHNHHQHHHHHQQQQHHNHGQHHSHIQHHQSHGQHAHQHQHPHQHQHQHQQTHTQHAPSHLASAAAAAATPATHQGAQQVSLAASSAAAAAAAAANHQTGSYYNYYGYYGNKFI